MTKEIKFFEATETSKLENPLKFQKLRERMLGLNCLEVCKSVSTQISENNEFKTFYFEKDDSPMKKKKVSPSD